MKLNFYVLFIMPPPLIGGTLSDNAVCRAHRA